MTLPHPEEWKPSVSNRNLDFNELHLWRARLDGVDADDDRLWQFLSAEERSRASRFHFEQHRYRFIRSHGILREILAGYLKTPAQELLLTTDAMGKPFISDQNTASLKFNLSHSGDLMVVGVTRGRDIGVDVEVFSRGLDWKQIALPYFHPNELAYLDSQLSEDSRLDYFYRIWVMKEAYLKARGKGISGGLDQVEVNTRKWDSPAFISVPGGETEKNRWQVFSFKPATGACGTVVFEAGLDPVSQISLWNWSRRIDFPG